jgi:DNA repair protein RecO (recombination protein O)
MLHKIRGFVLRTTPYSDNSLIVSMYTDLYGLQSYMARGVHSKTSKVKANYFGHLMLLDFIASKTEKQRIERIQEITGAKSFTLDFDPAKNALFFFLNELLCKTIHGEESNPGLFGFLLHTFELLQLKEKGLGNFHLVFLIKYSQYLGIAPEENSSRTSPFYFDLAEGRFSAVRPGHMHYIEPVLSHCLAELMQANFENCGQVALTAEHRKQLLSALLDYYRLQNALTADLSSHAVLEQIG